LHYSLFANSLWYFTVNQRAVIANEFIFRNGNID
jgi:hypothetical protein